MAKTYKYDKKFSGRLAVICSDERFIKPTLGFLEDELNFDSCDLMVLPGGPEFIANGEIGPLERLDLLVKAHGIKDIILISHEDCGYYNKCYNGSVKDSIDKKLIDDLKSAVIELENLYPEIKVSGFHCMISDRGTVKYKKII
jgi:hypothetical protein